MKKIACLSFGLILLLGFVFFFGIEIAAEIKRVSGTQLNEKYAQILLDLIEEGRFDRDEEQKSEAENK